MIKKLSDKLSNRWKKVLAVVLTVTFPLWIIPVLVLGLFKDIVYTLYVEMCRIVGAKR